MTTYQPLTLDEQRRTLKTCQRFDYEMRTRHYPAVIEVEPEYERDAAEFFAAEQCPSDAAFR